MSDKISSPNKKTLSLDWLVRGVLTKFGEAFDQFTGRSWKPSSNLATSELIEKLKVLLDAEVKDLGEKGKFVPHHIKLKMQWDKFSVDAEQSLKKLETELLAAAIDHINDRRYHTYAPMQFEIKPDYFTEGVKLSASFDKFEDDEDDVESEVNVTIPDLKNIVIPTSENEIVEPEKDIFLAAFTVNNEQRHRELIFSVNERKSVGRTKENDLWLDDASVSKQHATLLFNHENQLMVADTGSTNGTFVNGVRIAYGKAIALMETDKLSFGTVDVELRHILAENAEDKSAVQISSANAFAAADNPSDPNSGSVNVIAAKESVSIDENAIGIQIPMRKISPTGAKSTISKNDFAKANDSLAAEKEIAIDYENKTPGEISKDKV